jgi:hypothetical protein
LFKKFTALLAQEAYMTQSWAGGLASPGYAASAVFSTFVLGCPDIRKLDDHFPRVTRALVSGEAGSTFLSWTETRYDQEGKDAIRKSNCY